MRNIFHLRASRIAVLLTIAVVACTVYAIQNKSFWSDAAQSGMAEVALGNLAMQKSQNERVKQFADQMVKDHTTVNDELKSLAATKSVALPADVSTKQKATYEKLNGMSGSDFDREFMKVMVKDHEAAVKLFEKQSKSDADAEAKTFAAKNLPTLQSHLQMAESISSEIKQTSKGKKDDGSGMSTNSNSNVR